MKASHPRRGSATAIASGNSSPSIGDRRGGGGGPPLGGPSGGAATGIHQFCRVGRHAIIGGYSVIPQDVLPFSNTVTAREAKVFGANATGLERRGFSAETIDALHKAFRLLTRAGLNTSQAVARIKEEIPSSDAV